ncbi:MAG: hypothetical protein AAF078_01440 [Planctomycetota bacterium]
MDVEHGTIGASKGLAKAEGPQHRILRRFVITHGLRLQAANLFPSSKPSYLGRWFYEICCVQDNAMQPEVNLGPSQRFVDKRIRHGIGFDHLEQRVRLLVGEGLAKPRPFGLANGRDVIVISNL